MVLNEPNRDCDCDFDTRFPFEIEKYSRTGERNGAKLQAGMIVDASFSLWVATMMITFHAMINSVIASKPQFAREAGEKVCSTLKPQTPSRFPAVGNCQNLDDIREGGDIK